MKKILLILPLLFLSCVSAGQNSTIETIPDYFITIRESTLRLYGSGQGGSFMATGVIVKSNDLGSYAVTNKHFCAPLRLSAQDIEDNGSVEEYNSVVTVFGNYKQPGIVASIDITSDLCLLYFPFIKSVKHVNKFSRGFLEAKQKIFTYGNPGTFDQPQLFLGEMYDTDISGGTYFHQKALIHSEPGQSGSGIYSMNGELVGILNRGFHSGKPNYMITGMVAISDVRRFLCKEINIACE